VLKAVAEDLRIHIAFHPFDVGDRFAKSIEGVRILKSEPKPDAAILSVAFGQARPLLETAEAMGMPVFIQGPLFPSEPPEIRIRGLGGQGRKRGAGERMKRKNARRSHILSRTTGGSMDSNSGKDSTILKMSAKSFCLLLLRRSSSQ